MSLTNEIIEKVRVKNPAEGEFHQAVEEVMESLEPTVEKHPEFVKADMVNCNAAPTGGVSFLLAFLPFLISLEFPPLLEFLIIN